MDRKEMAVRIEELPVRPEAPLTGDVRNHLVKIVEAEFNAQSTVYNAKMQEDQSRVLDSWKRKLGVDKIIAEENRIDAQISVLEQRKEMNRNKLADIPFSVTGDLGSYNLTPKATVIYNTIRAELDAVGLKHPMNLKNKIITRLLIATTVGEALVILRQVLGNGVLPAMRREQLALPMHEKKEGK